jgi:hypothetical protein
MTFRIPSPLLSIPTLLLGVACGGKLVAEQPFALAAGKATIDWETTVPDGEASLWLDYALSTGSESHHASSGQEPVYHLAGTLGVTTSDNAVYAGVLRLDSEQPPTTQGGATVTLGASEKCSFEGCELAGRVRILELGELSAGSPLVIRAELPLEGDRISIEGLNMQLRAK